jgi:hypothetical protein
MHPTTTLLSHLQPNFVWDFPGRSDRLFEEAWVLSLYHVGALLGNHVDNVLNSAVRNNRED